MNDLIHIAAMELVRFLSDKLPELSPDWWQKHVVDRLSFQQNRMVMERNHTKLQQLDFAALLRVLDQNWYELSNTLRLPREGRNWVKELQSVRNRWAHLSIEEVPASEIYRDTDTLVRLLVMIEAEQSSLDVAESAKAAALATLTGSDNNPTGKAAEHETPVSEQATSSVSPSVSVAWLFKVGDLVALRSDPSVLLPVIEVVPGGAECRYRVFQNNAKATYYESQLQAAPVVADGLARPICVR